MGFNLNMLQNDVKQAKDQYHYYLYSLTYNTEERSLSFICVLFSRQYTTCDRTLYHIKDMLKVQ